jgi:hypothetical protein
LSQTVQFLSRFTLRATGGGIEIGLLHVRPSSVERLKNTVGTSRSGSSGIEETIHAPCAAS